MSKCIDSNSVFLHFEGKARMCIKVSILVDIFYYLSLVIGKHLLKKTILMQKKRQARCFHILQRINFVLISYCYKGWKKGRFISHCYDVAQEDPFKNQKFSNFEPFSLNPTFESPPRYEFWRKEKICNKNLC